jgi:hypothetical protein
MYDVRFMGQWKRVASRTTGSLYGRPEYVWEGDDTFDQPTSRDFDDLKALGGRHVGTLVAFDPRAGEPKHPNTAGGGYKSGGDRQSYVFRQDAVLDKSTKKAFKADLPENRTYFKPQNIQYSGGGSPLRCDSPGGTGYNVGPGYSGLYMVHPTYDSTFGIDMYGSNMPGKSPLPKLTVHEGSIQLTKTVINSFSCIRSEEGASLSGVMKNQSAGDAARGFGMTVTGTWAWLHLIAYTMGGQDGINPDVPENLVAGTSESNIYHLAIESAVKKLVLETDVPLKIHWKLDGKIDEDWHIAERIIYTVSSVTDPLKSVEFRINTWEHKSGYGGDGNAIYSFLKNIKKLGE